MRSDKGMSFMDFENWSEMIRITMCPCKLGRFVMKSMVRCAQGVVRVVQHELRLGLWEWCRPWCMRNKFIDVKHIGPPVLRTEQGVCCVPGCPVPSEVCTHMMRQAQGCVGMKIQFAGAPSGM